MTESGFEGYAALRAKLQALQEIADTIEERAAPRASEVMRNHAVMKLRIPSGLVPKPAVDTGNLRNSVESKDSEFVIRKTSTIVEFGIQTGVEYAPFIEYGTGPLGDPEVAHTDRTRWFYRDAHGQAHMARSQPARPFMRPALYENRMLIRDIIEETITEVFE